MLVMLKCSACLLCLFAPLGPRRAHLRMVIIDARLISFNSNNDNSNNDNSNNNDNNDNTNTNNMYIYIYIYIYT